MLFYHPVWYRKRTAVAMRINARASVRFAAGVATADSRKVGERTTADQTTAVRVEAAAAAVASATAVAAAGRQCSSGRQTGVAAAARQDSIAGATAGAAAAGRQCSSSGETQADNIAAAEQTVRQQQDRQLGSSRQTF